MNGHEAPPPALLSPLGIRYIEQQIAQQGVTPGVMTRMVIELYQCPTIDAVREFLHPLIGPARHIDSLARAVEDSHTHLTQMVLQYQQVAQIVLDDPLRLLDGAMAEQLLDALLLVQAQIQDLQQRLEDVQGVLQPTS